MPLAAQILLVPPVIIMSYVIGYAIGFGLQSLNENISHFCENPSDFCHFHASSWHDTQSHMRHYYLKAGTPFGI
jgi:hypothetical protein